MSLGGFLVQVPLFFDPVQEFFGFLFAGVLSWFSIVTFNYKVWCFFH